MSRKYIGKIECGKANPTLPVTAQISYGLGMTLHLLSMIYRLIAWKRPHWIPGFVKESAMGVDVVFR